MYNASRLQIKYLRIADGGKPIQYRWVRYVTSSNDYTCRLTQAAA